MPNAAQEAHFLIYLRKKKFTNCSPTLESSWIVCAPLTTEAVKRLKHRNNASKLRNRRFKVTIEYSFSHLVAPLTRPNPQQYEGLSLLCECFPPYYYKRETSSKAHVVTITLATQVTRKAEKSSKLASEARQKTKGWFKKKARLTSDGVLFLSSKWILFFMSILPYES